MILLTLNLSSIFAFILFCIISAGPFRRERERSTIHPSTHHSMAPHFRSNVWDPVLIISQIMCLQCAYYFSVSLLHCVICGVFFQRGSSLDYLFLDSRMNFWDPWGKCTFVVFLINPLFCSLATLMLIKRTKQCLDFVCTMHLIHLIVCSIYSRHFPSSSAWWIANILSTILTTVMSEYLCMRFELKEIPVGRPPATSA